MTAVFNNFIAIRKKRGGVLNPAQYRSIIEAIETIMVKYDFVGFNQSYKNFLNHLIDFDDPHHDADSLNFLNAIITSTYAIYTNMEASPLRQDDFTNQIANSVDLLEIMRRIVLNRNVYNQAKQFDGTVAADFTAFLSQDWGVLNPTPVASQLHYSRSLYNEADFIQAGWHGNTTPFAAIAVANNGPSVVADLPIVFSTSSIAEYVGRFDTGNMYSVPVVIASNDLTIDLQITGIVSASVNLFSLTNGVDNLDLVLNSDRTVSCVLNNQVFVTNPNPSTDGCIKIALQATGVATITTTLGLDHVKTTNSFVLTHNAPFVNGLVSLPLEDLITTQLGFRRLTVYYGFSLSDIVINNGNLSVPDGYAALTDDDGNYVTDDDGAYLIDPTGGSSDSDNYAILTDNDGSYMTDSDGSYLVDSNAPPPTDNYTVVTDADGSYLTDSDNSVLVTPDP
jgi:hypothetical protein